MDTREKTPDTMRGSAIVARGNINNLQTVEHESGYRHVDADPFMEQVRGLILDSGMSIGDIIDEIYDQSGGVVNMSWSTIDNWQTGKTKRPQNFTLTWVLRAIGYERTVTPIKTRRDAR